MSAGRVVLLAVAVLLHLAVGWPYLAAGLVVPPTAQALLLLAWTAGLAWLVLLAVRRRRQPGPVWPALLVPFGALALLVVTAALGGAVLGWTA